MASFILHSYLWSLFILRCVLLLLCVSQFPVPARLERSLTHEGWRTEWTANRLFSLAECRHGGSRIWHAFVGTLDCPSLEMASDQGSGYDSAVWEPYRPDRNSLYIMHYVGYICPINSLHSATL